MKAVWSLVVLVGVTGCAAIPSGEDQAGAELRAARHEADQRVLRALEDQNRLLVAELASDRAAAAERAELGRRLDELERNNDKLAESVAKAAHDDAPKGEAAPATPTMTTTTPTMATPIIDTTDDELRRLRAKLAEAGFGPVTLTPAQVRALLRALRPPRHIDTTL